MKIRKKNIVTSKKCFIATAAYGSVDHPAVIIFRNFRDTSLTQHVLGKIIVKIYYNISPALAKFIQNRVIIQKLSRLCLNVIAEWYIKKNVELKNKIS